MVLLFSRRKPNVALNDVGQRIDQSTFLISEVGRSNLTAGPKASRRWLTIQAMGCADDDGGLWFMVRGPGPNAKYKLKAFYPVDSRYYGSKRGKGEVGEYTYLDATETDEYGAAIGMRWDPFDTLSGWPDPEGIYRIIYTDDATGERVVVFFLIIYGKSSRARLNWWYRALRNVSRRNLGKLLRKLKLRR